MQVFLVLDDHGAHEAGCFIDFAFNCHSGNHVAEFDLSAFVGEDRHIVWIPLHKRFALLHRRAVLLGNH